MSEVEKMYENAGVKPLYKRRIECKDGYKIGYPCDKGIACINCNRSVFEDVMPPFTAEKQLELIKWLVQNKRLCVRKAEYSNNFYMDTIMNRSNGVDSKNFEVCLASQINLLWQDLTEQERTEIRSILNG